MPNNVNVLVIVTGLLIFQVRTAAQAPDFSGTWELNFEKSNLESPPNGLTSSLFIIKQEGDRLRLTRYHIFGDKKNRIRFQMVADGKTRHIKLLFNGKLEKKEGNLRATLWRKNFLNVVNYKFGTTQNEFIADETFTGKPQNYHNIWVFDRKESKE